MDEAENGRRVESGAECTVISTALELHVQLLKLATLITQPMREQVADPHDLSIEEVKIIVCLGEQDELTGRELSDMVAIQQMTASRALSNLEERGWVERVDERRDRRRRPVRLTPAGLEGYRAIMPSMATVADSLYGPLGARDQARLLRMVLNILHGEALRDRWSRGDAANG